MIAETPLAPPEAVPPPTLRSVVRQFRHRTVEGLVPIVLFIVLNNAAGLVWAMAAATAWSVSVVVRRRRRGQAIGAILPVILGYVLLRGGLGILTGSKNVYFGSDIANNFVIATIMAGSVLARRPIVGLIAPIFYPFPEDFRSHPAYTRVFGRLTLAWAALQALIGACQIWLLTNTSTNTFVVLRPIVFWPPRVALFVVSLRYPRRAFARVPELRDRVAVAEAQLSPRPEAE